MAVVEKGIDQRPCVIAVGRMRHHPGRLVHDQKMIVFEEYFQRYVFRDRFLWRRFGEGNVNNFTGLNQVARTRRLDRKSVV